MPKGCGFPHTLGTLGGIGQTEPVPVFRPVIPARDSSDEAPRPQLCVPRRHCLPELGSRRRLRDPAPLRTCGRPDRGTGLRTASDRRGAGRSSRGSGRRDRTAGARAATASSGDRAADGQGRRTAGGAPSAGLRASAAWIAAAGAIGSARRLERFSRGRVAVRGAAGRHAGTTAQSAVDGRGTADCSTDSCRRRGRRRNSQRADDRRGAGGSGDRP